MVPTVVEASPAASSEMAKIQPAAAPSSGSRVRWASSIEAMWLRPRLMKGGGRHHQHGGIDEPGHPHGDGDVGHLEKKQAALLSRLVGDNAPLGQRRVQKDHVGHDGGAENAGGQQDALRAGELGNDGMIGDLAPVGPAEKGFDDVAEGDDPQQGGDDRLHRAKSAGLQGQDEKGDDRGDQPGEPERTCRTAG